MRSSSVSKIVAQKRHGKPSGPGAEAEVEERHWSIVGGLTLLEIEAWKQHTPISKTLPGTHQVRVVMGHGIFGNRVFYGDILFLTVSPSERLQDSFPARYLQKPGH